jgi:hypothetical protein
LLLDTRQLEETYDHLDIQRNIIKMLY